MRKAMIVLLSIALVAGFITVAVADQVIWFPNGTSIEKWNSGATPTAFSGGGVWVDVLGTNYESYGGKLVITNDLSSIKLYMWTEFGPANVSQSILGKTVEHADLFLYTGNSSGYVFDTAIRVSGSTATAGDGSVFTSQITNTQLVNDTFAETSSVEFMTGSNSGGWFGGKYDAASGKYVPVIASGTSSITVPVTWSQNEVNFTYQKPDLTFTTGTAYEVVVELYGLFDPLTDDFAFLWGTGQCANDTIEGSRPSGVVPLPGAFLLLGAGLVRLTAYARKRRLAA